MKRRDFLKNIGNGIPLLPFMQKKIFARLLSDNYEDDDIAKLVKKRFDELPDLGNESGWLINAYAVAGVLDDTKYDELDRGFIYDALDRCGGRTALAYASTKTDEYFDQRLIDLYENLHSDLGSNRGWLVMAYAAADVLGDTEDEEIDREGIDNILSRYGGRIAFAYASTKKDENFDLRLIDLYENLHSDWGSWLTMAFVAADALSDTAEDLRTREELIEIARSYDGIVTLGCAIAWKQRDKVKGFYRNHNYKNGQNREFITMAYGFALNPSNKLFPRTSLD